MPGALHLLKAPVSAQALATIAQQAARGAPVTVVLLPGVARPELPDGVEVRYLVDEPTPGRADGLTYPALLDLIFASDQVVAW
jgi:hypothetical protein